MGSIKNKQIKTVSHILSEAEFNYVANVQDAKRAVAAEYDRVTSAFLKYLATSRFGYKGDEELQFELDFTDKDHKLKVTILEGAAERQGS